MKSVEIYRIEHKETKFGPYRDEKVNLNNAFHDHQAPMNMKTERFIRFLEDTPHKNLDIEFFGGGRYGDYKYGFSSLEVFKQKFNVNAIEDLITYGFHLVKIIIKKPKEFDYFIFQDGQIMFIETNTKTQELSFDILR